MVKHVVLVAAQKASQLSLLIQTMFLLLHFYTRYSGRRTTGISQHFLVSLRWSKSCPPTTHVPPSAECSCKLCSETKDKFCSMFGIKDKILPIDLKWGTLFRCLHSGAGTQDPSAAHGNILMTVPLE